MLYHCFDTEHTMLLESFLSTQCFTPSHSLQILCVLCIAHSAFPFFNSFHQCIQEPVSKRAKLTTRSKAKLQVPSQSFFFNVFIVARPAGQPFPILESQTIQKAKRQWITSFNFFSVAGRLAQLLPSSNQLLMPSSSLQLQLLPRIPRP